jgi:hypothetical protein
MRSLPTPTTGKTKAKAIEAGPSLRFGMTT